MGSLTFFLVIFVSIVCQQTVVGSRILIAAPHGTKSHHNVFVPLTQELVRRGHDVTFISNYVSQELTQLDRVQQISLEKLAIDTSAFPNPFEATKTLTASFYMVIEFLKVFISYPTRIAQVTYSDDRIQRLLKTDHFDLVMFSETCRLPCYPLGWHFKAPVITLSPNVLMLGRAGSLGDEEHLSYVPFILSPFTNRMSLYQRLVNVVMAKTFLLLSRDWNVNPVHSVFKELVDPDCPPLLELEKNFSLVFTNSHPSFNYPRVLPPQVIEVGGLHCRTPKPLTEELDKFVSGSDAGFIIFGVGSALKMDDMPEETVQSFIKAFQRLPQRIIWQWKGQVRVDLPANILAIPWLPQQDLLGHPNCKAFITHGGLNSLQEAIFHRVPVLGLPIGTDQFLNILRAVREGYALKIDWPEVTEELLFHSIQTLITNPSFQTNVDRLSRLFRDQSESPLERAVYWTEYVLRHKSVDHLRLASVDLAPYQRALIDVYAILVLCTCIPLLITYSCLKRCCYRQSVLGTDTNPTTK